MWAVIGTSPSVDVTVAMGPFTTPEAAYDASGTMDDLGYVSEVVELEAASAIEPSPPWDGSEE
jgi:hypothetical protein